MKRSQNTNPAMVPKSISPHAMGGQAKAGGEAPGHPECNMFDPPGLQRLGEGPCAAFSDPRTPPIYAGRDTPLDAGRPEGRKPFIGTNTGAQEHRIGTPAASNWDTTQGGLDDLPLDTNMTKGSDKVKWKDDTIHDGTERVTGSIKLGRR